MNLTRNLIQTVIGILTLLGASVAMAFDSGSTGADGAFSPTADTTIVMPDNGILNFTTFNVPEGVTVRFGTNAANTPAFVLVQGDAVIDGTVDVSGIDGGAFGFLPPGAYAGGQGQGPGEAGANGQGPGGGRGGALSGLQCGGHGGGYAFSGGDNTCVSADPDTPGGQEYGSPTLQPLLGGSGGGSGALNSDAIETVSAPGGSGGGALLLAVAGALTLNGSILADGGRGADAPSVQGGGGGGGSGGGVRLVASQFDGAGAVDVRGGARGVNTGDSREYGGAGAFGRLRIETEDFTFTGTVEPPNVATTSAPQPLFIADLPGIRITSVAGQAVSPTPNGVNDVVLPADIVNPVAVEFAASGVPLGNQVLLTVNPTSGALVTATSTGLIGTVDSSTAGVDIDLPLGSSVLTASVTFIVTGAQSTALSAFTGGEPVAKVELTDTPGQAPTTRLITASGKAYTWPSFAGAMAR